MIVRLCARNALQQIRDRCLFLRHSNPRVFFNPF
ncbi:hypothetical protein RSAG8_09856, partial [Rhizoctonia solani AG-8 WAC10335]